MRKQVSDFEVMDAISERLKNDLTHSMQGIVTAYYPGSPATVDVQPAVNDVRFDTDTDERASTPMSVIPKVPIVYPCGGGYVFTFPLAVGDKVQLVADDLDPTAHRLTGRQSDPIFTRRHAGAYWKAFPGDVTDTSAPAAGSTLKIGKGAATIEIDGSTIALGGESVTDNVALASLVKTEFAHFATWIKTGVAPSGGGLVTYATPAPSDDVKSTLVKSG